MFLVAFLIVAAFPFEIFTFNVFVADVAQKLIGEDHVVNGISVYVNNADPKGSRAASRQSAQGSIMPFQYSGFSSRGGPGQSSSSRYFGGNNNPSFGQPSSGLNQGASGFNNSNVGYNAMNPAVLAAALDTWNTMVNGMFASGAAQGRPAWQNNNNDMKKDANPSNWSGKGDFKWS